MNDEPDNLLERVTPRGAPAELRARVLASAANELGASRPKSRGGRVGWAILCGIMISVALNFWVGSRNERRLAELYGPDPPSSLMDGLQNTIESATDAETAKWFTRQFTGARRKANADVFHREQVAIAASTNS